MKKLTVFIVSLMILVLSVSFIITKKQNYSINENRYLTSYPSLTVSSLFNGSYTKKIGDYLSDHFVYRDSFISLKNKVQKILGMKKINDVYLGNDYLLLDYKKSLNKDKIIDSLNSFYKELNYLNVELMLVPTSIEINKDKLPKYVVTNEFEDLEYYQKHIKFNMINIYDTLKEHNGTYDMFYHTDHHWTTYGAYYAYQEYAKSNNLTYIPINDFSVNKVTSNFKGSLYSKILDNSISSDNIYLFNYDGDYTINNGTNTISSLYDMDKLNNKDKYEVFLGGNYPLVTIKNNDISKKKLLIIKDSYANSIVPFLINHFSEIDLIDSRYYNDSIIKYVKDNNITDILILYNIGSIDEETTLMHLK